MTILGDRVTRRLSAPEDFVIWGRRCAAVPMIWDLAMTMVDGCVTSR